MASRLPLIITCALLSGAAGAAELGEAQVRSHLGQQLAADIELTMLDAPATPVQVRLADPNVYRGANIGMPHVLSTLNMTVTQRNGRQFLHVTSLAPVESSRLHLYLELADGGQRGVRLVTLSMAPNPNPPPPPAPARIAAPVVADTPAPAPVVAKPPPKPRPLPPPKPVVAKIAPKPKPEPEPEPEPESRPEPKQDAKPVPAAEPKPAPKGLPLPLAAPAAPAACAPAPDVDRSTVCAALDYKNAQLREQIGQLEDKVKVLQVALGASPAAVGKPRPADPNKPHPARRRPAPESEPSTPWGWIAGGVGAVLALAGAAILVVRRRKRAGRIQPMPGVPLMTRLRQRFGRKKASQEPVEPKLDDAEQEMSTQV
jgi:pilus assembly protein FimV